MEINLKFCNRANETNRNISEEQSNGIHYMPCLINAEGVAAIKNHFDIYVEANETSHNSEEKGNLKRLNFIYEIIFIFSINLI